MTAPVPPDDAALGLLLRRLGFLAATVAVAAVFALSLLAIASTRATLRPDGQAAALAAEQRGAPPADRGCRLRSSGARHSPAV